MTETTKGLPDLARNSFNDLYDLPPDERPVETTAGIDDGIKWLMPILLEAYTMGYKRGTAEGKIENVF